MTSDPAPFCGPPDLRGIHRTAASRLITARRHGRVRDTLRWTRILKRATRSLKFTARLRAGQVQHWLFDDRRFIANPHSSHPLFSGLSEKTSEPATPENPDRRHTFREGRRRQ